MNLKVMNLFLSDENIKKHLEHFRTFKLKYSVLEKSVTELKGMCISEVFKSNFGKEEKTEALTLLWQIKSHELFFKSFSEAPRWNDEMKKHFSSRDKFLYDILCEANDVSGGFLYVYKDRQQNIRIIFADEYDGAFVKYEPMLCLDLYEHTYFADYGFNKEKFLKNALAYFDTGRLV